MERTMRELRFDGRVAIVTGAGGNPSLGRAHALLLASRGAAVVVNDCGPDPEMRGYPGEASAEAVAAEIRAAGGRAVANTQSVTTPEGAAAIVATALDSFGRLDILINNAAVSVAAEIDEMTPRDFSRHIAVNLMGPIWCCRAAWPHLRAAGYGRIVNITSAAMTGFARQTAYAASKGGLWSLTRALAAEGAPHGIKVNAVSPGAYTRLVQSMLAEDSPLLEHSRASLPAGLASPVVAFLAHESCPVTGECFDSVGGAVQRTLIARTPGIVDPALTIEAVAAHWDEIMADGAAAAVGIADFDTAEWKLRPYRETVL
jgi:NAD(P)-dependent dehydrogenase (short-subunit alcohol dehydrogenase family)